MNIEQVLECNNLSKIFGNYVAVKSVSFSIHSGEIYGLVGPNGAGKSTLLSLLCNLLHPTTGDVKVMGQPISDKKKDISVFFQTPSLYPYLSVLDNIRVLSLDVERALLLKDQFLLNEEIFNKPVHSLSYGQKKRVSLVISLSKNAQVYLLDEPTNGLDLTSTEVLCNIFKKLASEGKSVIIASHEWGILGDLCDRIGIIVGGQLKKELTNNIIEEHQIIELSTDLKISEESFKHLPLLDYYHYEGEGNWKLAIKENKAEILMRIMIDNGIPIYKWNQQSKGSHWYDTYKQILDKEGNNVITGIS